MPSFAIIIPCYNEANRLQTNTLIQFANTHSDIHFYFINDGSTDNTHSELLKIKEATTQTHIISLEKNTGKGEAVRQGLLSAIQHSFLYIGYLDADLSTSLEELYRLKEYAAQNLLELVLASRIKKIDTIIERSFFRHIIGRGIATIIDERFNLGVYDTQCGAKIFKSALIKEMIKKPFYTKWLFDVEILLRIKKENPNFKAAEVPLHYWKNVQDSKINFLSFPTIIKEIMILLLKY